MQNKIVGVLTLVLAGLFLTGCSSIQKMPLEANKVSLAKVNKPIGVFTVRTANAYKPSYDLDVKYIVFSLSGSKDLQIFKPSKPYQQKKNEYLEYLVSVDLNPGDYSLLRINGKGTGFLISGGFSGSVNARFNLVSGITYLGHVTLTNRERKEGEERSGPLFPLIDQAVLGFSGGTLDITVTDRGETDIPDFVRAYPLLKDVKITKTIMQKGSCKQ